MKITAAQLIEELQKVPGDTEVQFEMDDGCCGDYMELELGFAEGDNFKYDKKDHYQMRIRVHAIEGFTSCIKAGKTKRFTKALYEKK